MSGAVRALSHHEHLNAQLHGMYEAYIDRVRSVTRTFCDDQPNEVKKLQICNLINNS